MSEIECMKQVKVDSEGQKRVTSLDNSPKLEITFLDSDTQSRVKILSSGSHEGPSPKIEVIQQRAS